jgi:uncharacterized protein YbaR (Trm112 family)
MISCDKINKNLMEFSMNQQLLNILVCPLCKSDLIYDSSNQELICKIDALAYTIREGIPVMLLEEARSLEK